jgi:hypothetical protein
MESILTSALARVASEFLEDLLQVWLTSPALGSDELKRVELLQETIWQLEQVAERTE